MNREAFFQRISHFSAADLQRVQWAYLLAKTGHREQKRDGGERYFEHPRNVALTLLKFGYDKDADMIIAALLHDVPEDTYIPPSLILQIFGGKIWTWLNVLSKQVASVDPVNGSVTGWAKKPKDQYAINLYKADSQVRIIKCADRHNNLETVDLFERERRKRYLTETRELYLPMARENCPAIARAIQELVDQAEKADFV